MYSKLKWWSRRTWANLLLWELQNCKQLLNNHRQENVGSHQKMIPMSKGKGEARTRQTAETDSWRAQKILVCMRSQEKGVVTPTRDWARLACECSEVSSRDVGQQWPAVGHWIQQGLWIQQAWHKSLSLASGQTTGREHHPTHQQKTRFNIYWAWTYPSE